MGSIEDYLSKKKGKLFRKEDRLIIINRRIKNNRKERKTNIELEKAFASFKGYTKEDKKEFDEHIEQSLQEFCRLKKKREKIFKEGHYY